MAESLMRLIRPLRNSANNMNEYVEFVEADEDEDHWYYEHAKELAEELLER